MKKNFHFLFVFIFLAYAISWVIWLPLYLPYFRIKPFPSVPYQHAIGALGPMMAAMITTFIFKGTSGLRIFLLKLLSFKGNFIWYIVALGGPFLMLYLGTWIVYLMKDYHPLYVLSSPPEFPQFNFLIFFLYNFFFFGLGEEVGWRGFALAELQKKFSLLKSSLLLSLIWAGWHIPLFFYRPGYLGMETVQIFGWMVSLITGSILLTWLYHQSMGVIWVVGLFHATIDIPFTSTSNQDLVNIIGALITVWGIVVACFLYRKDQKVFK